MERAGSMRHRRRLRMRVSDLSRESSLHSLHHTRPECNEMQRMQRNAILHTLLHPIEHGARVRLPDEDFWQMKMF